MFFRRKKKAGESGIDPNAWMMSYADMVTILLAMFIVLSTLSKDQTGLSLYYGTGSYRKAVKSFGLPSNTDNTAKTVPLNTPGPRYSYENPNTDQAPDTNQRIIDAEEEMFQHYLSKTNSEFSVQKVKGEAGRSAVDFHNKTGNNYPRLTGKQREMIIPLLVLAHQKNYRVEITAWATTPAETACTRAMQLAADLREEALGEMNAPPEMRVRVSAIGQPWRHRNVKRPIFSVVIIRDGS